MLGQHDKKYLHRALTQTTARVLDFARPHPRDGGRVDAPLKASPNRRLWRRIWLIAAACVGVLVVCLGLFYGVVQPLVLRAVRNEIDHRLEELSKVLGREVSLEAVDLSLTENIVFKGLRVPSRGLDQPTLVLPRVAMAFSVWDVITGKHRPSGIRIEGLRLTVHTRDESSPDLEDLVRGLVRWQKGSRHSQGGDQGHFAVPDLDIVNATVVFLPVGKGEPSAAIKDINCELRSGEALEASFSAVSVGLADSPVRFSGVATYKGKDAYASVDFDAPVEPLRVLGKSARATLTGFSVERLSDQVAASIRGLSIPDTTPLLALSRHLSAARGGPLSAFELRAEVALPSGGLKTLDPSLLRSLTVRGLAFQVAPPLAQLGTIYGSGLDLDLVRDQDDFMLRMAGSMDIGTPGKSLVRLDARVTREGMVKSANLDVAGPLLRAAISAFHPRLLPWDGRLDTSLSVRGDGRHYEVAGRVDGRGLNYFWTKLCLVPLTDLAFQADVKATLDLAGEKLHLVLDPVSVGLARFAFELDLERFNRQPKIKARFSIPRQPCANVASAVPRVMIPRLDGAVFDGELWLEVRLAVDLKNPYGAKLDVDGDLDACTALTLGPLVDVDVLNQKFTHRVVEEDLDEPILVGPATQYYVPITDIPEVVQQAAMATEDMGFFRHHGFKLGLIRRAVGLNLDKGWYVYGGSTISQQLVKNLYLSREKTLARKLEEAVIVWDMERKVDKQRILELYLNIVEFGRHIYGIKAAAAEYFNKEPRDLTPLEAAFIMATKPAPRYAWNVYRKRQFNEWWVSRMEGILRRLWSEMHVIDEAAYQEAAPYLPLFWYKDKQEYARPEVLSSTVVPPGMPAELPKPAEAPDQKQAPEGKAAQPTGPQNPAPAEATPEAEPRPQEAPPAQRPAEAQPPQPPAE